MAERGAVSVIVLVRGDLEGLLDLVASVNPQLKDGDEIVLVLFAPLRPATLTEEVAREIERQNPFVRVLLAEGESERAIYEQAIGASRGAFVFLAEPGDIWMPYKLSNMLDAFVMSGAILVLHDAELLDETRQVLAPSLFALHGSRPGFEENLIHNSYLGSCLAFLEPFKEFFLPIPPEVSSYDQWMGLIAERFGGVAFVSKPLIGKKVSTPAACFADDSPTSPRERRDRQRHLLKALRKREKELRSLL
ncbi:MAG: hypothetical protein LBH64_01190 [Coriobacteriales bacterium]|nr:hypothetical protein [Coriobacteriales bacterium]